VGVLINVPVGLLALGVRVPSHSGIRIISRRSACGVAESEPFSFDGVGLSLLVIVIVCWEVTLSKGQEWDWLGDPFWRVQTLVILFAWAWSG
jgi:MFS transporter, DHA2 family, multidrug resistance protein